MSASIIRPAHPDELDDLRTIERAAAQLFRDVGMDYIADQLPTSLEVLRQAEADGFLWVAEADETACGFAATCVVDGNIHIEELDIHPDYMRRGIGSALVEFICKEARDRNFVAVTLSTFSDVPWNGPFYEKLGFAELSTSDLSEEHKEIRQHEKERGLDVNQRVIMRRHL